jgi:ABC-2 type transport system ATP-binding protein
MSAIIKVNNLTKEFRDVKAVDDLSFTVEEGKVYGFLGQNGAGKSTTIRMLLTLVSPESGEIEMFGMDLSRNRNRILRNIGAIIERPDLYKYLSARENLSIFAALSGIRVTGKQIMDQLEMVGLAERAGSKVRTYSQGMRQRLGIATALIHDPQLIILDEPTNGLDPQGIADVRNLILHLSNDRKKTVFISSHLLNEMELIADSMLIIDKGKKVAEGSKEELLNPSTTQVELITDNTAVSLRLIRETAWGRSITTESNGRILLSMDKGSIPQFNRVLVEKGINVLSLKPKHSLEDYFLSLTAH